MSIDLFLRKIAIFINLAGFQPSLGSIDYLHCLIGLEKQEHLTLIHDLCFALPERDIGLSWSRGSPELFPIREWASKIHVFSNR